MAKSKWDTKSGSAEYPYEPIPDLCDDPPHINPIEEPYYFGIEVPDTFHLFDTRFSKVGSYSFASEASTYLWNNCNIAANGKSLVALWHDQCEISHREFNANPAPSYTPEYQNDKSFMRHCIDYKPLVGTFGGPVYVVLNNDPCLPDNSGYTALSLQRAYKLIYQKLELYELMSRVGTWKNIRLLYPEIDIDYYCPGDGSHFFIYKPLAVVITNSMITCFHDSNSGLPPKNIH